MSPWILSSLGYLCRLERRFLGGSEAANRYIVLKKFAKKLGGPWPGLAPTKLRQWSQRSIGRPRSGSQARRRRDAAASPSTRKGERQGHVLADQIAHRPPRKIDVKRTRSGTGRRPPCWIAPCSAGSSLSIPRAGRRSFRPRRLRKSAVLPLI
jgi:hypothetical protein